MATTAFSSADEAILEHRVELDPRAVETTADALGCPVADLYDVAGTAERLVFAPGTRTCLTPPLERVALQFSDEGLVDAVPVFHALKEALEALTSTPPALYILADTSYGSCCVDEVAAAHVQADAVVHYGHACMSPYVAFLTQYRPTSYPVRISQAHGGRGCRYERPL